MERFSSKEILYHGTSPDNILSILSQGLVPDPKKRVWQDDPDEGHSRVSRASFPGIYLTGNFMTAYSSAGTASRKTGKTHSGAIVVVQAETRTLVADEDNLVYPLQQSIRSMFEGLVMNEWLERQAYLDFLDGKLDSHLQGATEDFLRFVTKKIPGAVRVEKIKEAVGPITKDILAALLERNMLWQIKNMADWEKTKLKYEFEERGYDLQKLPSKEQAGRRFRDLLDLLARKLAAIVHRDDNINPTARAIEPIRFSGANRILAVMEWRRSDTSPTELAFRYGAGSAAAAKLVGDWEKHIGDNYVVVNVEAARQLATA